LGNGVIDRRDPISWSPQSGTIQIGLHITFPMTGWLVHFDAQVAIAQDPQNEFAATNIGWLSAARNPPIYRRTYSGTIRILAPTANQALDACIPGYPSPNSSRGEVQEGPVSVSKPTLTNPTGEGYQATCSWSVTYRSTGSSGFENLRNRDASTWTGVKQQSGRYV